MSRLSKCTKSRICVRMSGHAGVCSPSPNSATAGWDRDRILKGLDFRADPSLDWLWNDLNGAA